MRKDIKKLIMLVQPQVIGLLKAHGYIKNNVDRLSLAQLTQEGKAAAGTGDLLIKDDWLAEWRELWPIGFRGTKQVIRDKLGMFLMEKDVTLDEIMLATKCWLEEKESPFHGQATYFFYKEEEGTIISRCEEYIEIVKASKFIPAGSDDPDLEDNVIAGQ